MSREEIRERAEFALSDEMDELLMDAPEDAQKWVRYLAADVIELLDDAAVSVPVVPEEEKP